MRTKGINVLGKEHVIEEGEASLQSRESGPQEQGPFCLSSVPS